jgi:hypothetical protein
VGRNTEAHPKSLDGDAILVAQAIGQKDFVDQKGHFSLHEYQHTDLSQKFKIINQLEIN